MSEHVEVIAEAGVNHNGSIDLAFRLVDVAAAAGADYVKFQAFTAEKLVSKRARKAAYQIRNEGDGPDDQLTMLAKLELDRAAFLAVRDHCQAKGVQFLATPFDEDSATFLLDELGVSVLKVSSGDLSNAPFLHALARRGVPMIISTGMATMGDVEDALQVIAHGYVGSSRPSLDAFREAYISPEGQAALRGRVTVLHCTTEYPTRPEDVNLRAMNTLRRTFDLRCGYSDHTEGLATPVAAVALGAMLIEKHFTLDRRLEGPDHAASLEPAELGEMVKAIRVVEAALGRTTKYPVVAEEANRKVAAKSIVAARDIPVGETFTPENLACKRPADGLPPTSWWTVIGQPAKRNFTADEAIEL